MTVRDHLDGVERAVTAVAEPLGRLRTMVAEDRPAAPEVVVPQLVLDEIDDEAGWLDGASTAASVAARAWRRDDTAVAVEALAECDRLCAEFARRLVTGLAGTATLTVLTRLADDRPGPWRRWALDVHAAVLELWVPTWLLQEALRTSWRECAVGLVGTPLPVRLTSTRPHPAPSLAFPNDR